LTALCLLLTVCLSGGSWTLTRCYNSLDATDTPAVGMAMSTQRYLAIMLTAFTTSVTTILHLLALVIIMTGVVVMLPFLVQFGRGIWREEQQAREGATMT
jgi:hypothetical protein